MPINITPRFMHNSVGGISPSRTFGFGVSGSDDEQAVATAIVLYLATNIDFYGDGSLILPRREWRFEHKSLNMWEGEATYAARTTNPSTGDNLLSFDTTGGTQHITQSRQTVTAYSPNATNAPDFKGGINCNYQGVEGIDIPVPALQFARTLIVNASVVTNAYVKTISDLTATVNQAAFYGFNAGEVLFLGARGQQRPEGNWELSFQFARQPNLTGFMVPGINLGIDKKGWEYLWVLREPQADTVSKVIVQAPRAAYVERVFEYGDFSLLGV